MEGLDGVRPSAYSDVHMTAREDTKQALWFLLLLLQTIILAISGWSLNRTVETGERVARLEAKIDFLAREQHSTACLPSGDATRPVF